LSPGYRRAHEAGGLNRHAQLDPVIGRIDQILLCTEVSLSRLDRRVAQEHLDLLQLAASGPAQFGARPAGVVWRDAGDTGSFNGPYR
jgi:hypothetical protein